MGIEYCYLMSAMKYVVIAFYKFFLIEGPLVLKRVLEKRCKELGIRGSIILSTEGINGTVAGKDYEIKSLIEFLKSIPGFSEMVSEYLVGLCGPVRDSVLLVNPTLK